MTLYYCQRAFKHRGDWGYNLYGFCWVIQIWAMESIPCLTNLLATRRAHNIPWFRNWLFQLKPNSLDGEFKDEMDVVKTSEPTDVERQQPYMIVFDNNLYMSPDMHLRGGLLNESQKEMMEEHGDLPNEDEELVGGVDPIDLTSFASLTPNINIPNEIPTVIALEKKDP
ncbi:hypothetical protein LWI29_026120 [Acer saccharum]|uniref:Uncharacterized protein n=1 Tax=Acer saccharum TaxID=4024 RepID=A0AA39TH26_ACESA|nr:hypothetical protein LWI29_026120 [Acer saccharum]